MGRFQFKSFTIEELQPGRVADSDLYNDRTQNTTLVDAKLDQIGLTDPNIDSVELQRRAARVWSSIEDPDNPGHSHYKNGKVGTSTVEFQNVIAPFRMNP